MTRAHWFAPMVHQPSVRNVSPTLWPIATLTTSSVWLQTEKSARAGAEPKKINKTIAKHVTIERMSRFKALAGKSCSRSPCVHGRQAIAGTLAPLLVDGYWAHLVEATGGTINRSENPELVGLRRNRKSCGELSMCVIMV